MIRQRDRHQGRGIFQCGDAMDNAPREVQELACTKDMAPTFSRDIQCTFEALNRDVARHLVWRQCRTCHENQTHDLEVDGLEESGRLLLGKLVAQRLDVDGLTGTRVLDGHAASMRPGLLARAPHEAQTAPRGPGAVHPAP